MCTETFYQLASFYGSQLNHVTNTFSKLLQNVLSNKIRKYVCAEIWSHGLSQLGAIS